MLGLGSSCKICLKSFNLKYDEELNRSAGPDLFGAKFQTAGINSRKQNPPSRN
jgi:hypothetical protein